MNAAANLHGIALAASELLIYSVVAGTLLAVAVWLLLQVFPRRDSRTSFVVWFATLMATAVLPLLSLHSGASAGGEGASRAVFTISTSWAWGIFGVWAVIAIAGLARVGLATLQVWKLRAQATDVDMPALPGELRALIEDLQRSRPVRLMTSPRLEVPTAIGFRKPAIILPAWLLESTPPEELKYILLHELAHLWRRDDWTNLAQKVLKALLFFLPSVWWIERRLTLEREMACDDAVLAQTGTPHRYAECLAHVAEKSFLRRQLALAQAAVGRMRQLTARVTMILDPNRPRATQLWKPAIPAVIVLAGLSALPASLAPSLVGFADVAPVAKQAQADRAMGNGVSADASSQSGGEVRATEVRAIQAAYKTDAVSPRLANTNVVRPAKRNVSARRNARRDAVAQKNTQPAVLTADYRAPRQEEYITVRQEMFLVVTERTASGEKQSWQMHVVEVSVQPQSKPVPKPRKI
jgi:beta-lactamase regulating signal transducer with metallopeptidase domain